MSEYDYRNSGYDDFLSRSIDNGSTITGLGNMPPGTPGSTYRQVDFDQAQVSGQLGDVLQVGQILIDGKEGRITVSDGEAVRILIGFQQDGF